MAVLWAESWFHSTWSTSRRRRPISRFLLSEEVRSKTGQQGRLTMAITNPAAQQMFGSAVAHGITPRTVATWSSLVPRTPRVMVPIQLDALVVRQGGAAWAD